MLVQDARHGGPGAQVGVFIQHGRIHLPRGLVLENCAVEHVPHLLLFAGREAVQRGRHDPGRPLREEFWGGRGRDGRLRPVEAATGHGSGRTSRPSEAICSRISDGKVKSFA